LDGATTFFADVLPELTSDFNVIVFHLPYRPRTMPIQNYTLGYIASVLREVVVDDLALEKVSIIGESFGGVIAEVFAVAYPELVDRLVLLSSLAKTSLPPDILFKLHYVLPVVESIGHAYPG
jgi:pimeloyl-ACP methyl ester carboxylesterase